jgi:hypothetical protein
VSLSSQVEMGSMIYTVGISQFGFSLDCIRKHRTTIAATCAVLFTIAVLVPVYLVLGQRQQKTDLSRLTSSYQVLFCQVKYNAGGNPKPRLLQLSRPSTAAATEAHVACMYACLCTKSRLLLSCSACMRMAVPRHAYVYLTMLYYTRVGCRMYIQVTSGKSPSQ